jgi:hypothetical protein
MRHPFQYRVHAVVHQKVADPQVSSELLRAADMILGADTTMIKFNQLSMSQGRAGAAVPLKLVVARGRDFDAVTLTIPKPLTDSMKPCAECEEVGYIDMAAMELCTECNGLGYLEVPL